MKTAIFSQFFINEKRVFSQFFINEKRVFSFNESHKNALRNAVFLMRGMLIFWMSFIWIFETTTDDVPTWRYEKVRVF